MTLTWKYKKKAIPEKCLARGPDLTYHSLIRVKLGRILISKYFLFFSVLRLLCLE